MTIAPVVTIAMPPQRYLVMKVSTAMLMLHHVSFVQVDIIAMVDLSQLSVQRELMPAVVVLYAPHVILDFIAQ